MGHWAICITVVSSFLLLIWNKINIFSKSLWYFWLSFIVHQLFSSEFCLCQLFLFLLYFLSILLAVSLATLHLLMLPSKKKKWLMCWTTKAVKHVRECGLLHWWVFFKNTPSSKYWLIRDCGVIRVTQGYSVTYFIHYTVLLLKLRIKKKKIKHNRKKTPPSPFCNLYFGLIFLLWALTCCWCCSCNDLPLQFLQSMVSTSNSVQQQGNLLLSISESPLLIGLHVDDSCDPCDARPHASLESLLRHCYLTYSGKVSPLMVLLWIRLNEKNCQQSPRLSLLLPPTPGIKLAK